MLLEHHASLVFDDYGALEEGAAREYLAPELMQPRSGGWVQCRLTRPTKDEFRMVDEASGSFLLAAKKIGDSFFISMYSDGLPDAASGGAVLTPDFGRDGACRYALRLLSRAGGADEPLVSIWPSALWDDKQKAEVRRLRVALPPANPGNVAAHYVHDWESPPAAAARKRLAPASPTVRLANKVPHWNSHLGCLSLSFGRKRVKCSSTKNFLIFNAEKLVDGQAESAEDAVFQLGKAGPKTFALDFKHPLSPLQALAIALTAFSVKHHKTPKKTR
ncbi:tubby C-terminal-like domain-containing protein [Pelagophyceae sp. CCMP2097]|nr:tubby C-terminal-like domain-containing protein [Pelagophyceae sp. CCMP2097]|mmetsp:Transcript_12074/g.40270  ORF Transcript_12074/g.40270 Transcript_12074/m.40270 type:complete len:275 (-) Transcript_12074:92-916(-)